MKAPSRPVLPRNVDADGDRIANNADVCPGTPPGFRVDARGCVVSQGFYLSDAYFTPDSAVLSKAAWETLNRLATALKVQKDAGVDIAGATAGRGTASFRSLLADQRREALRQHLIKRGVAENRIIAVRDPAQLRASRTPRIRLYVR